MDKFSYKIQQLKSVRPVTLSDTQFSIISPQNSLYWAVLKYSTVLYLSTVLVQFFTIYATIMLCIFLLRYSLKANIVDITLLH